MPIDNSKKIREFLAKTISEDADELIIHPKNIFMQVISYSEFNTETLNGLYLKLAELRNTVFRLAFGRFIETHQKKNSFTVKSKQLKHFQNTSSIISVKSADNNSAKIFLDVTFTMGQSNITGIPRVVTQLSIHGNKLGLIPVFLHHDFAYGYDNIRNEVYKVEFNENDIFIHSDAGWNYPLELHHVLNSISSVGGVSVIVVHDLIPLIYPQLSNNNHVKAFQNWMDVIISESKYIICVSKSVADELLLLLQTDYLNNCSVQSVGWAHWGSDFQINEENAISAHLRENILGSKPYFLSVGTVEPRKAYTVGIEAMEQLWALGIDASYVIVGKYGWAQSKLKAKIMSHPEYGSRLFWFNSASDTELQLLYKNALALVFPSLCEGFGLPVIEAAHYGLSSIVSDIPVLREIGGNSTQFFEVTNSNELAKILEKTLKKPKVAPDLAALTWEQAVANIFYIIKRGDYQYNVSGLYSNSNS